MDKRAFDEMKSTQQTHWWFRGKRLVLEKIIKSLTLPLNAQILEIGAGTGGNFEMLSRFGKVTSLELDDDAREYAKEFTGAESLKGWLPDGLSAIEDKKFDLICLFDVLEHVREDEEALAVLKNYLNVSISRGGGLLITVPAYQWMYSKHDERLSHFRRYTKKQLCDKLKHCDYEVKYAGYMNMLLFPIMALSRILDKLWNREKVAGVTTPSNWINQILYGMFAVEGLWIPNLSSPFGGSVVAVAYNTGHF